MDNTSDPTPDRVPPANESLAGDISVNGILNWLHTAETSLANSSDRLNAINIFPVADGDTGSNLYYTVSAARKALNDVAPEDAPETLGDALHIAGNAAMDGARGNSGTLIAVILAHLATPLEGHQRLTAQGMASALQRAHTAAWSALSDPQEGTLLTVLSAATNTAVDFCRSCEGMEDDELDSRRTLYQCCTEVVDAAWQAVRRTENELDALTEACVVDSGGIGLLLVLDALRATVMGEQIDPQLLDDLHGFEAQTPHLHQQIQVEEGYEVTCSLELTPLDAATLRFELDELGDSVIMSPASTEASAEGDSEGLVRWRMHVHVSEAEPALELLKKNAEPENLTITALHQDNDWDNHQDQHCESH